MTSNRVQCVATAFLLVVLCGAPHASADEPCAPKSGDYREEPIEIGVLLPGETLTIKSGGTVVAITKEAPLKGQSAVFSPPVDAIFDSMPPAMEWPHVTDTPEEAFAKIENAWVRAEKIEQINASVPDPDDDNGFIDASRQGAASHLLATVLVPMEGGVRLSALLTRARLKVIGRELHLSQLVDAPGDKSVFLLEYALSRYHRTGAAIRNVNEYYPGKFSLEGVRAVHLREMQRYLQYLRTEQIDYYVVDGSPLYVHFVDDYEFTDEEMRMKDATAVREAP